MRGALVVASVVSALAIGCGVARSATETTRLTVTVWPHGDGRSATTWTLRCDPPSGTHPRRAAACAALARAKEPFAPVPRNAICTQIYGGPQEALVRGTYRGRTVRARFERTDGCEITRWNRMGAVFPIRTG